MTHCTLSHICDPVTKTHKPLRQVADCTGLSFTCVRDHSVHTHFCIRVYFDTPAISGVLDHSLSFVSGRNERCLRLSAVGGCCCFCWPCRCFAPSGFEKQMLDLPRTTNPQVRPAVPQKLRLPRNSSSIVLCDNACIVAGVGLCHVRRVPSPRL